MEKDVSGSYLKKIGENVKRKRMEKELSMEKLGLEMGLTRMQINRIEKGYNITMTTLLKLSLALGAKPEELIKTDQKFKKEDLDGLVNHNKASKLKLFTKKDLAKTAKKVVKKQKLTKI